MLPHPLSVGACTWQEAHGLSLSFPLVAKSPGAVQGVGLGGESPGPSIVAATCGGRFLHGCWARQPSLRAGRLTPWAWLPTGRAQHREPQPRAPSPRPRGGIRRGSLGGIQRSQESEHGRVGGAERPQSRGQVGFCLDPCGLPTAQVPVAPRAGAPQQVQPVCLRARPSLFLMHPLNYLAFSIALPAAPGRGPLHRTSRGSQPAPAPPPACRVWPPPGAAGWAPSSQGWTGRGGGGGPRGPPSSSLFTG